MASDIIYNFALMYRRAIQDAFNVGAFDDDIRLCNFPRACCGDVSCLLGSFLIENGLLTKYVCGNHYEESGKSQSHAWLELEGGTVIDITGDQFKYDICYLNYDVAVYVGKQDDFHKLFENNRLIERESVPIYYYGDYRLNKLYNIIKEYM